MTPTTITRADELAKAAAALLRDEPLSEPGLAKALAAYRAARSTDGACDDTANTVLSDKSIAELLIRCNVIDECAWNRPEDWDGGTESFNVTEFAVRLRAAIDVARAASGSGVAK